MFRKLRNKLIIINVTVTTIVLVTAFAAIYIFATQSANKRPLQQNFPDYFTNEIERLIQQSIDAEKKAAAQDLLRTLIISGVAIEVIVAVASFYLAEEAIKPVREAYETQKIFIANASHEIKTPLAAISANLEAADIHGNKWINNVEKEVEKLSGLNGELLTLARTDLVEDSLLDEVDLKKVTAECLKGFESRLAGKTFKPKYSVHGKVKLSKRDYEQVLGILMDNAIKYSDKLITLEVTDERLVVGNDGAVISVKDLPHVFERFYQADKSSEGVGLGLSIAKSVAMRNGWELSVDSDAKMTRFILELR